MIEKITDINGVLKVRPQDMHKGQAGRVLIIGGQEGMAGAAVLAARGALYSGAGLVKISALENLFHILQTSVTEAMCITRENIDLQEFDVIAIGPGLGVSDENGKLLQRVLTEFQGPVVIDADGLNCLCDRSVFPDPRVLTDREAVTVMTPHPGEADRLLRSFGCGGYKLLGRERSARELAAKTGAIVLLKGQGTLIASGSHLAQNTTGNPGMATGGSGDVLTGIIASFIAQGMHFMEAEPLEAVYAAAFIHGAAGDIAADQIGQYGMTSADIADAVSQAIKEVTGF
ncbi:MAG: NAD(P)H-hydrate dehydratase [Bacillota bacterium]|nr:NAD(P)H-hydrate dehydratase [Bacillota bacterium]